MASIDERLSLHRQYWAGADPVNIPVSFRLGDYFFADKYEAARPLLQPSRPITPQQLAVDDFLADYERMYQETEAIGQDGFFAAEPFVALPWMEAILGCPVFGDSHSLVTKPVADREIPVLSGDILLNNPWFEKYLEFTRKLVRLSGGRFPVAQPIMRGPADVAGAMLGQTRLVYEMNDNRDTVKVLLNSITTLFLRIIREQFRLIPNFQGGSAIGFYHLWTPGPCIWFQEDLTSLLSPAWYRDFIQECDQRICTDYNFSMIHVHPSSFHVLNSILELEGLRAVEVNKDVGGPSVRDMLPVFSKIRRAGKLLVIWGSLDEEDIRVIRSGLSGGGVFLNIVAETAGRARELLALLRKG